METTTSGVTRLLSNPGDLDSLPEEMDTIDSAIPRRVNVDPEDVEKSLTKLVLVLVELLRRLMEHQAMRRVESGSLTDEEIERLGDTFLKLNNRMQELKLAFGLENEELNLNLGPLGDLM